MISTWKRRRAARRASKQHIEDENPGEMELAIPKDFRCPISLELMKDPVTVSTGITYDRENIDKWIERGNLNCPVTNQRFNSLDPIPNHTIRKLIQHWCVENTSYGIQRIPTPRIPVSSIQVLDIQSKLTASVQAKDEAGCKNLVAKMKGLMKESERNKKCFVANGTAGVLSEAFDRVSRSEKAPMAEDILSVLTLMFPLDREARSYLGSSSCMDCLLGFLKDGDLAGRRNSVLVLKEIVSSDERKLKILSGIEGAIEAIFKVVKNPICPAATKASLVIIYQMVNAKSIKKFVDMGIVSVLTEILVDSEKSTCEKALGVLDGICSSDEGRYKACENCLTIPVVVKKMHRVSELATEFSVSILWKLCKNEKRGGHVFVEALQVGAFQKLLLQLQVGCGETTKEKATELLKLLNPYRERLECVDSSDFKDLKRPL
ncbi:U-box domain-containing protein 21 [Euphorbia peplus]|nr:U-box domain-containing protein 21 [Euphorbia peplus]